MTVAALSQTGGIPVTFAELNNLDTHENISKYNSTEHKTNEIALRRSVIISRGFKTVFTQPSFLTVFFFFFWQPKPVYTRLNG